jgi:hypothetical protein
MKFTQRLSEEARHIQGGLRQSVRAVVGFRIIVEDKAGFASGQVIDMTTLGCGLRLTRPLRQGQCLTLKTYSNDEAASVMICNLARVQWANAERAGVAFLSMSRENKLQLSRLCSDRLIFTVEG